jgi:hypothetical protein
MPCADRNAQPVVTAVKMLSAATTAMAKCHRRDLLAFRRFTVPRPYNTSVYESPFKAVNTIGGFAKNAERLARRNRLCRGGLATIDGARRKSPGVLVEISHLMAGSVYRLAGAGGGASEGFGGGVVVA